MQKNKYYKENIVLTATLASSTSPSAPIVFGGDPEKQIQEMAKIGYQGVELHWGNPAEIDLNVISYACEKNGLTVSAFGTGRAYGEEGLSLIDDDSTIRTAAVQRLKDFVDAAAPFHATVIIGCMRGNLPPTTLSRGRYLDRLAESTKLVALYAQSKDVPIVFEPINRYENNYLNNVAETIEFIKSYQIPNTKILLDTFHMNIEDENLIGAIETCNKMIGYIHFADSNRKYVGSGHIPFSEIIKTLKRINYKGNISAECLPLPNPETAAHKWIDEVKNLL